MTLLKSIYRFSVALSVAATFGACGSLELSPPSGTIAGIPATQAVVHLPNQQKLESGSAFGAWVIPQGDYTPSLQDKAGIYFQAPSRFINIQRLFGMPITKTREGGVYLSKAEPTKGRLYFLLPDEGGEIARMAAGVPFLLDLKQGGQIDFTLLKRK